MKSKNVLTIVTALSVAFTFGASLYINLNKETLEVDAYDASNLPTTIDLNDCSDEEIRSYYAGLDSLDASERKGTNLLKNLKPILSNNQKYYSYDSGSKIWQIYEIADRDWDKSPAESTTYGTYSAITNKITGYQYGTSASKSKNNPYIHALYVNRNIENQTTAWDDHNQDAWGINREHIWAKSHGFDTEGNGGARGDPMHLWAANGWANHEHSNYFFAFVDKSRTYSDSGSKYNTVYNNLKGYSLNAGGSQTVFEPQDSDKGDIARAIFYMVARYNNYANEASGFDSDNPNLVLLNNLSENSRTGTSSANDPYGMGLLSDLLAWNRLDPVDEYEIHRNNLLYRNYTNNRNPFIDFPSWADAIWGTVDLDGTNYDSTTVGQATPASDPISSFATAFDISSKQQNLLVGETASISGRNANDVITWTIDDNTIVSLNKTTSTNNEALTMTALKSGTTTITATCGGDSVVCSVTVSSVNYGTLQNPLSVDEAIQVISLTGASETAQPLYVRGIASSSSYNQSYSNFNYVWLRSDDGNTNQAFELFRAVLDGGVAGDYTATNNALLDKEVIAYGYGKYYNSTTYELCTSENNPNNPIIKSVRDPDEPEIEDYLANATSVATIHGNETPGTSRVDSITFSAQGLSNGAVLTTFDVDNVTLTFAKASGNTAPAYYDGGTNARLYKSNTLTFTSLTNITRIQFSYTSGYASGLAASTGSLSNDYTVWTGSATSVTFTNSNDSAQIRMTSISITHVGNPTVSGVAMRFGMSISQDDWNAINAKGAITDYGVMFARKDSLDNDPEYSAVSTVIEAYNAGLTVATVRQVDGGRVFETPYLDGDNYLFTVRVKMTSVLNYDVIFCAAPFIVAGGQYYFLDEMQYSVESLAQYYFENGGSSLSNAALSILGA